MSENSKEMEQKFLVILEVSQKQSYIFGHKKLQNNIIASELIRYVTNTAFFEEEAGNLFKENENLVYDGGGHTILEFATLEKAKEFVTTISVAVIRRFPQIELFAKVLEYDNDKTPAENEMELIRALEEKKARRSASFRQGKFGIEAAIDAAGHPENEEVLEKEREAVKAIMEPEFADTGKYHVAYSFEKLGGEKGKSNFIAVVHIDGNLMGKRVSELPAKTEWKEYKKQKRDFSEAIDKDFKDAYREMIESVDRSMPELSVKLSLGKPEEKKYFPVRRIITAGDDVCFVTEGRIGIECAAAFLKAISKRTNPIDGKGYSACAGVAIVHQKYPFYRAYDLAEELCANAKRYIAGLAEDQGGAADVCAIDWHIEYGEMSNGLSEIRKQYRSRGDVILGCRPYLVCGDAALIERDPVRKYEHFRTMIREIQKEEKAVASGKVKNFRTAMKGTKEEVKIYIEYNKINHFLWSVADQYDVWGKPPFYVLYDGQEHIPAYDAIEMMDCFAALSGFDGGENR